MEQTTADVLTQWKTQSRDLQRRALDELGALRQRHIYRESWQSLPIDRDMTWDQIPFLSKQALIDHASKPFSETGQNGEELAHVFVAPGPLFMPFTEPDMGRLSGSFALALRAAGFGPGDMVDQTTMYNWVIAATALGQALRSLGCCVIPGGVGQTDRHIEAIMHLNASGIVAFPTFLEHLLDQAEQQGTRLPLKKAAILGELSHPDTKTRLRDHYGLNVSEIYGVADVGAVAFDCTEGNGMHLRDDILVEFISPDGQVIDIPTRATPGEIVVTDIHRQALPIVRLRTGDLVNEFLTDPCPCGRHTPRIRRIVGRTGDITKVKGMFVVPGEIRRVLQTLDPDPRFRLLVDRHEATDRLTVEFATEDPFDSDELKQRIEAAIRIKADLVHVAEIAPNAPLLTDNRATKLA